VNILNELYGYLRFYTNHFQPVMQMKEKIRIGSKIKKSYHKAKTAYARIIESDKISDKYKDDLKKVHQSLDVYDLRKNILQCRKNLLTQFRKKNEEGFFK